VERPGRPFGVSLAIIASTFLFTLLPLLQVAAVLLVQRHFLNMQFEEYGLDPVAMGGDFLGVPQSSVFIQTVLSLIFLMIAVQAWRGRPEAIRFIIVAAVFGLTAIKFISLIAQALSQPDPQAGFSSLDSVIQSLGVGQLVIETLVVLYVAWYMNRGPARAFYRGYYLSDPAAVAENTP
jgi:hypothetical protein